jgi:excinuclease ABC subunit A
MRKTIEVKGARENNLKNMNVKIPRNKFTVITGVSGSGKSSLAYDVIYAEGQRRLLDSLSAFSRRYIPQPRKADVDFVFGLSPVVAIMQRKAVRNPRSTVGTLTDIYDYLRLLYSIAGTAHCPYCGHEIPIKTVNQIIERIQDLPEGTSVEIRAPVVKIYNEDYDYLFTQLRSRGYRKFLIDGEYFDSGDKLELDEYQEYQIEAVLDRVVIRNEDLRLTLEATIDNGMRVGEGFLVLQLSHPEQQADRFANFYQDFTCPEHHVAMRELEPYYFSFNVADSACKTCDGIGQHLRADPRLLVVHPHKSIRQGALTNTYMSLKHPYRYTLMYSLAKHFNYSLDVPYNDLPESAKNVIMFGTGGEKFELIEPPDVPKRVPQAGQSIAYEGLVPSVDRWYKRQREVRTPGHNLLELVRAVMVEHKCPDCQGTRLQPQRLCVTIGGLNIHQACTLPIDELSGIFETLEIPADKAIAAESIIREVVTGISLLVEIGVGYLSLNRELSTISGGESQRVRLSTQIGSGLMGMMYILDEPSIGLHARDSIRIIKTLKTLRDIGNSVIVVEHDPETISSADHVIEIGPGPGVHGGKVVAQGTVEKIKKSKASLTGQYLSGRKQIDVRAERRSPNGNWLHIIGARENNLQNINVKIPLGVFICVTGVSGSGKSSLIHEIVYKSLHSKLRDQRTIPGEVDDIEGIDQVNSVVNIDQMPIGSYWTSNPATYIGIHNHIRKLFANLSESKERGYTKSNFSYNSKEGGGRCEECNGRGVIITPLQFMADVESLCPVCKGYRYQKEILEIEYQGKNIYDVLNMDFEEAETFFGDIPPILRKVKVMNQLGLGYLKLGQTTDTLSGGEAQRVKLASELAKVKRGHRLYLLDEPTTGLHLDDIQRLLDCLNALVDAGHTVIVIEHHMDVIKTADYIIDLGPEGGNQGGYVVAQGTPEEILEIPESYTGQYLKQVLNIREKAVEPA